MLKKTGYKYIIKCDGCGCSCFEDAVRTQREALEIAADRSWLMCGNKILCHDCLQDGQRRLSPRWPAK